MTTNTASAPGKIILTGEYAVVFGYPGIAVPAPIGMEVTFEEDTSTKEIKIEWEGATDTWIKYAQSIIDALLTFHFSLSTSPHPTGAIRIQNQLPLGKGMGSSTTLVITICRCLLGPDCRDQALEVEDAMNPGHSGVDFAVIWKNAPVLFKKGEAPQSINMPQDLLKDAVLIDTGTPEQTTPELVAWVKKRKEELKPHFEKIGKCTERLMSGENLRTIMHDHHRAQVALGIVPQPVQGLIASIEDTGGTAKVLGAGSRSNGAGIVLALGNTQEITSIATSLKYTCISIS